MSEQTGVRRQQQGPVAYLWLARPSRRNALDEAMIAALREAVLDCSRDTQVRALVIGGDGELFCAGADIDEMRQLVAEGEDANRRQAEALADLLATIHHCPKPVIARVHGAAYGGGVGLLAACDLVIATPEARFALTEVRLGIAAAIIAPYVVRRIGAARTCELALTGEPIDAQRACHIGLVTEVAPEGTLDAAVARALAALLRGGPQAQVAVKRLVDRVAGDPAALGPILAVELARLRASPEGWEGLCAFLEKRRPAWCLAATDER